MLYISLFLFGDRLCLFTVKTNVSYAEAQEPSSHPSSSSFFFFFFSFSVRWASYSIIYKTPGKVPSFVTFLLFAFFFLSLNYRLIWSLFFIILTVESSNTPGGGGGILRLIFTVFGLIINRYVQNPYPIMFILRPYYIPHLSHFWTNM